MPEAQYSAGYFRRAANWLTKALVPAQGPSERDLGGNRDIMSALPRRPETGEYADLITTFADKWSLPRARSAILEHDQGQFADSALLVDFMVRDDRIASCLNTRIIGLHGLPQRIQPSDEKSAKAREVAKALEADWEWIAPPHTIEDMIRWEAMLGFSLFEQVWDTHRDRWIPRLKFWHPQYLYYRLDLRQYVAIAQDGLAYVTPGDGKWVLATRHGHYRAWMQGAVRALFVPWYLRQQSWRDWGRYNEVHGAPIKVARVPASASDADKNSFWRQIRNLASMAAIMAPKNKDKEEFALELVEAANHQSWEAFERAILRTDSSIQLELLGQNLSGGDEKGGSYAKAKVGENVRSDFTAADARIISNTFYAQTIRAWTVFNFGDESLTPRAVWDATPPEDAAKSATTFKTAMEAVQIAATLGGAASIDTEKLIDTYALPLKPGVAFSAPAPTSPPPDGSTQTTSRVVLSRTPADPMAPARSGQLYVDRVVDNAVSESKGAFDAEVLRHVDDALRLARDFDELKHLLLSAMPSMHPTRFQRLLDGANQLALAAGTFTARKEAQQ